MENIFVDFIGINMYDKTPTQTSLCQFISLKETSLYERGPNAPKHAANLVANSDNTAFGVESIGFGNTN